MQQIGEGVEEWKENQPPAEATEGGEAFHGWDLLSVGCDGSSSEGSILFAG